MIRCICVDDEAYAANLLGAYIKKIPFLELVGTTTSPIEALTWVQEGRADLVFLDIQMPELTGIQFLKICGNRCKVILTTAYPEYALDGYEHDVVDYLLKPIPFDRFFKAVQKAQALFQSVSAPVPVVAPASTAMPITAPTPAPQYMFIKGESKNKFLRVDYADILFVEALKNYVSIHVPGQRIVTYQTLKDLDEQLPQPPFFRVHKSFIVSLDKIKLIDGNTLYIEDKAIPLGETYRESFYRVIRDKEQV